MDDPDHNISMDYTNILEVEPKWFERDVKEVILIQTMQPSLNKEWGRYNLLTMWSNLLKGMFQRPGTITPTPHTSCENKFNAIEGHL